MTPSDASLAHVLERTVTIRATRETVFRFFTESALFAAWWGKGSAIDPRPGGALRIVYPDASVASGTVLAIEPPVRVEFSYGYESAAAGLAPGASHVTVTLEEAAGGTRVRLRHALPSAALRDHHVQGWRFQLALFANAAARVQHEGLERSVDAFLALWGQTDEAAREAVLARVTHADVVFRDAYSATSGREDLAAHLRAAVAFMPGVTLAREGAVLHCQGTVLADWIARAADGTPRGRGRNVFELAPDGRITSVTGFWLPA